jgi:hypothetical protein
MFCISLILNKIPFSIFYLTAPTQPHNYHHNKLIISHLWGGGVKPKITTVLHHHPKNGNIFKTMLSKAHSGV